MSEAALGRNIQVALAKLGAKLFRNNVGKFWTGRAIEINEEGIIDVHPGDVVLRHARRVASGLPVGSGDFIGYKPVVITEKMLGQRVAIFTSAEVKLPKGKTTEQQDNWRSVVGTDGGIAIIARSVEEAIGGIFGGEPN